MWCEFYIQLLSNIGSGIIIALLFFLLSDYVFKIPKLSGFWIVTVTTLKTSYNPYKDMVLTYKILIWLEGKNIYGSGEKIKETTNGNIQEYVGKNRSQIKINGSVLKKYLTPDKIVIHIEEKNIERNSSTIYLLEKKKKKWVGKFYSTVADSEGKIELARQSEVF